jgi:transcriptional regulator with XRE-family HTH domain
MFPDRMISLMKEKKITRKQMSRDLNFGINQIKYWEENHNIPNAFLMSEISNYLGTTAAYLIEAVDDPAPSPVNEAMAKLTASMQEALDSMEKEKSPLLQSLENLVKSMNQDQQREMKKYAEYLINSNNKD